MISLIHPSRGRPQKAFATAKKWIDSAGANVEHIISIDANDTFKNEYSQLTWQHLIVNDNNSVVEATNHAAKMAKGDILIYLSDDFECPDNWAMLVEKEFEERPMLLKVDDCLQKFEVAVLTIPIMNRKLYDRLGHFWHPDYKSMFCDEDLFWTVRKLGALKMAEHLKFPHIHPANGKAANDETYKRSALNWDSGQATFKNRRGQGFPI
jgi:hypothetical protein